MLILKSIGVKYIKYDIPQFQIYIAQTRKYPNAHIQEYNVLEKPNMCYIF